MKCWLCEREDLAPGEGKPNMFGDIECYRCTANIDFTVQLMVRPELIPLVKGINQLPVVDGVSVGIKVHNDADR